MGGSMAVTHLRRPAQQTAREPRPLEEAPDDPRAAPALAMDGAPERGDRLMQLHLGEPRRRVGA